MWVAPVWVIVPLGESAPVLTVPVVVMVEEPLSIVPNPDVIEPAFKAPTVVTEVVTTPDASVDPVRLPAAAAAGAAHDGLPDATVRTSLVEPIPNRRSCDVVSA